MSEETPITTSTKPKKITKTKSDNELTERKIELLTKIKHMELKLRHRKKRQYNQTQKLSKLLFFLHCLQMDRGIPINTIYEEDNF